MKTTPEATELWTETDGLPLAGLGLRAMALWARHAKMGKWPVNISRCILKRRHRAMEDHSNRLMMFEARGHSAVDWVGYLAIRERK